MYIYHRLPYKFSSLCESSNTDEATLGLNFLSKPAQCGLEFVHRQTNKRSKILLDKTVDTQCEYPKTDDVIDPYRMVRKSQLVSALLANPVFEVCRLCGDLVRFGGINSVFEADAFDDFGKVVKSA